MSGTTTPTITAPNLTAASAPLASTDRVVGVQGQGTGARTVLMPISEVLLAGGGFGSAAQLLAGGGETGGITAVNLGGGLGLNGGTLSVTYGAGLVEVGGALTVEYGMTAGTVAAGNDSRITGALQRSGGTLTGPLTLAADPTSALQAATMQFVQNAAAVGGVDARAYGVIMDGRDITTALLAAIAAAGSPVSDVILPSGTGKLSQTLIVASGIRLIGRGRNSTLLFKNSDYGDLIQLGTSSIGYLSGGLRGMWLYHDYGTGAFPPTSAAGMANPTTNGTIIQAYLPSHAIFQDMILGNGKGQWNSYGGSQCQFFGVETYGVYDPTIPALQESLSSWCITGNMSAIPTGFEWFGCNLGGTISPARSISWPNGNTTTTVVQNIGPLDGLLITCMESGAWHGGYIGACAGNGVHLKPASGIILSAVAFLGHFQDSCQSAGLCLDNSGGGTPADITWAPRESNGQANGLVGVSDRVSNLANWSCIGLIIGGFFRAYVGTAIDLYRAASVVVSGGTNVRAWNYYGWYASDAGSLGYDAGMRIGGTCESVLVQGLFGGGSAGAGLYASIGYYDEIAVRYSVSGNPSNVTLNLGLGVGTSQSASL